MATYKLIATNEVLKRAFECIEDVAVSQHGQNQVFVKLYGKGSELIAIINLAPGERIERAIG